MAPSVAGVWLIMSDDKALFNPMDWGYDEIDNAKFYKFHERYQEEIDQKFGKEVGMVTRVSKELLMPQSEITELGLAAPSQQARKEISDKILTCSLWRYTERSHGFYRLFPCNKALFCTGCLHTKLYRITQDFHDHVALYLANKQNTNVCIHHYVFHPTWQYPIKDMTAVQEGFAAIARFRQAIAQMLTNHRRKPRRVEYSIGPAIWGIHCLRPTWNERYEPIPHLHLAFVTRDNFRPACLNDIAEKAASKAMDRTVRLDQHRELQFARDKSSIDYSYYLDPVHRRKLKTEDEMLALCSYVASPIKQDTSSIMIAINGLTIEALAGGRHYGFLNKYGTIPARTPNNFYKPDIAAYICKLGPNAAQSRWYKQP